MPLPFCLPPGLRREGPVPHRTDQCAGSERPVSFFIVDTIVLYQSITVDVSCF